MASRDSSKTASTLEVADTNNDYLCGMWGWRPACLNRFATSRTFLVVYGLLGTVQAMAYVYFISTLTTLEKRFKIPSKTTGIMLSGNEVSQIMLSLFLTYYGGQGRRPLWIAWGVALSAASCFILTLPHFVFGAGPDAIALTEEYLQHRHFNYSVSQSEQAKLCSWSHPPDPDCPLDNEVDLEYTWLPAGLVFLSQFVLGVGTTLYFSLGQTYLDDNTKKTNTPMLLGLTMALRTVGPAIGFVLGFACLSLYIDPSLTPVIGMKDPRWLGAWWLGWILLGSTMFMFAALMAFFPRFLPKKNMGRNMVLGTLQQTKEALSKDERPLTSGTSFKVEPLPATQGLASAQAVEKPTLKAFPGALMRLLQNKLLLCNIWSGIFYILGGSAYITFITKYMEVQFQQSSAKASMITAPISILAMMTGFLVSGWAISRFKPRPLYLLSWNVIVGATYVLSEISFIFLGCPEVALQGYRQDYQGRVELTMPCNLNCGCQNIKYDPVCFEPLGLTFYSACHAGCTSSIIHNDIKMYDNCTCVSGGADAWRGPGHGSGDPSHHHQYMSVGAGGYPSGYTAGYGQQGYGQGYTPGYGQGYTQGGDGYPGWTPWPQVSNRAVRAGPCDLDCHNVFFTFIIITTFMHSLGSSGKVGNLLVNYRAVDPKDKAFAQGLSLFLISIFAFIPGPILFGAIIDSTCLVWDESCGRKGNCWLYDKASFRTYINATAAGTFTVRGRPL
ncbi:solute carrier organic anion transporter family member 74D isoform X2 [Thrips palmi]|uniref:Solute carrier organic anion transporter family member n=1 Tax=Thrips palmi TaxID=161013 RepID=A0A6P8ZSU0_THRPL|nr:solute carrier organic anion transporter family member 74D isoform X2 [Thrips palmi]